MKSIYEKFYNYCTLNEQLNLTSKKLLVTIFNKFSTIIILCKFGTVADIGCFIPKENLVLVKETLPTPDKITTIYHELTHYILFHAFYPEGNQHPPIFNKIYTMITTYLLNSPI